MGRFACPGQAGCTRYVGRVGAQRDACYSSSMRASGRTHCWPEQGGASSLALAVPAHLVQVRGAGEHAVRDEGVNCALGQAQMGDGAVEADTGARYLGWQGSSAHGALPDTHAWALVPPCPCTARTLSRLAL